MRAAIYTRVSTEEQAREGISLDAQEAACRREALAAGHTEVDLYCDDGYSGSNARRPALRRLLDNIDQYGAVHVWKLDRLSRSVSDWCWILGTMRDKGVGFASVTEKVDATTPFGRAMLYVLAVFAELFLDILRENVRSALDHIASTGRHPCGSVYGYDRRDGHLVVNPKQAAVVREVFARYADGASLADIALDLQTRGVPTRRGGRYWTASGVRQMLGNATYAGLLPYKGEVLPATHEAIVDEDMWARVQERRRQRRRNRGQVGRHYSALCCCGLCGGPVRTRAERRQAKSGEPYRWTLECMRRSLEPRDERHAYVGIGEPKLGAIIWRHTELLLRSGELRGALSERQRRAQARERDVGELQRRLHEISETRQRNLQAFQAGALTLSDLQEANGPLVQEDAALRQRLQGDDGVPEGVTDLARMTPGAASRAVRVLQGQSMETQLMFLSRLYETVEVYPDRLVFHYHGSLMEPAERPTGFRYDGRGLPF